MGVDAHRESLTQGPHPYLVQPTVAFAVRLVRNKYHAETTLMTGRCATGLGIVTSVDCRPHSLNGLVRRDGKRETLRATLTLILGR